MASDDTALITLGPFLGVNTHSAGDSVPPGYASLNSNVDTSRNLGAFTSAQGRTPYLQITGFPSGSYINTLLRYDTGPNQTFYIAQSQPIAGVCYTSYVSPSGAQGFLPITQQFLRGVQSNGRMFLDNGQQIFLGTDGFLHAALWQYPSPGGFTASYTGTAPGGIYLAQATYSYAFVKIITLPTYGAPVYQQTTPYMLPTNAQNVADAYGNQSFQAGTLVISNASTNIALTGQFYGTTPDGYSFVTAVYRMSSNSNVFQLLVVLTPTSPPFSSQWEYGIYTDNATDVSIAQNQQLVLNRQQPPTGISDYGVGGVVTNANNPIESLQDRMWVLAREANAYNNNIPQTQLWYSNVGQPYSFDASLQVVLVGDEHTTLQPEPTGLPNIPYGDQPTALCKIGSQMLVYGSNSTGMLYGNDQTNYTVLPLFTGVGCIASLSPTKIGEGLVAWLAAQGAYSYDQSTLVDLSTEEMWNYLRSIPVSQWSTAVGFFKDKTWFLSFPQSNVTLTLYMSSTSGNALTASSVRLWNILPYATNSAAFYTSIPATLTSNHIEQVAASRYQTNWIDFWSDAESDLGSNIVSSWTAPIVTSKAPYVQKTYRTVSITAPPQNSYIQVVVAIDPGFAQSLPPWSSPVIDLSKPPYTKLVRIPQDYSRGYAAQVTINAVNDGKSPTIIWNVSIGGSPDRVWTIGDIPLAPQGIVPII